MERIDLVPEEAEELSRRLTILHELTYNSRMARANRVQLSVTYYESCRDENHEAYGLSGRYKTVSGICWQVDAELTKTMLIDGTKIPLADIIRVESVEDIFEREWEEP